MPCLPIYWRLGRTDLEHFGARHRGQHDDLCVAIISCLTLARDG